jgi:hypothetical protein
MITALIWFATFTLAVWLLFYMFGDTFCGKAVHAFVSIVFELLILTFITSIVQIRGDSFSWFTVIAIVMYVIDIIKNICILIKIKFKNS